MRIFGKVLGLNVKTIQLHIIWKFNVPLNLKENAMELNRGQCLVILGTLFFSLRLQECVSIILLQKESTGSMAMCDINEHETTAKVIFKFRLEMWSDVFMKNNITSTINYNERNLARTFVLFVFYDPQITEKPYLCKSLRKKTMWL